MAINVDVDLEQANLEELVSLAGRIQLQVRGGMLCTEGHVEYGPHAHVVKMNTHRLDGVKLDYVHAGKPNRAGKEAAKQTAREAEKADNHPQFFLRLIKETSKKHRKRRIRFCEQAH